MLCEENFYVYSDPEDEEYLKEISHTITELDFRASFLSLDEQHPKVLKMDQGKLMNVARLFPHVRSLSFSNVTFDPTTFGLFRFFNNLRELTFVEPKGFEDAHLKELAPCEKLECLRLFQCSEVTDVGFSYFVENCKSLIQIDAIECTKITQKAIDFARSKPVQVIGTFILQLEGQKFTPSDRKKPKDEQKRA